MNRTEYIRNKINENYSSIRAFAEKCGIPYTTVYSILKRGIGNSSVDNVLMICKNLGITIEEMETAGDIKKTKNILLSHSEECLIRNFRSLNNEGKEYILKTMDLVKEKYIKSDSISELEENVE